MQKRFIFILIALFSCEKQQKSDSLSIESPSKSDGWIFYEGRVPLDESCNLFIEVAMLQGNKEGEGSYKLKEFIEEDFSFLPTAEFNGKYSTFYGAHPEERILQFHNSVHPKELKRRYLAPANLTGTRLKVMREEVFRNTDLTVRLQEKNKLVVLDDHQQPLTVASHYNLTRRISKLFTIEGYFRHTGDTAEFFEVNTREKWPVSKFGVYHQVIRQYHILTSEKFEVTYLKGVGYWIYQRDENGNLLEVLVFKKVLQLTASPGLAEEYDQLAQ